MKCTGKNIVLEVKSPYLGEDFPAQKLYVLKSKDNNENETRDTAYFLDVAEAQTEAVQGSTEKQMFSAGVHGSAFEMTIDAWTDAGDGTVIRRISKGDITYQVGHLSGIQEPVSCVLE